MSALFKVLKRAFYWYNKHIMQYKKLFGSWYM